jgi:hypothetical protein
MSRAGRFTHRAIDLLHACRSGADGQSHAFG